MSTLSITRIGVIDTSKELHRKFINTFLDYKRDAECAVVYALYKEGNHTLAVHYGQRLDQIINEQMHI